MFVTVQEAAQRIRDGRMVIVVDGPDRENEGDLTVAAELVTPEAINFMIRHGRGLVCMPCDATRLEQLAIGPMHADLGRMDDTAFMVSIDHRGCGSGISVRDRAATIRAVTDPFVRASDFSRPGHIFPLRAREGGVLRRPGHTEAAVDLMRLAGLFPCAAICEVLNDEGLPASGDELAELARAHDLALVSIEDMIAFRRTRASSLLLQRSVLSA